MADLAPLAGAVARIESDRRLRDDLIRVYLALDIRLRPTYAEIQEVTGLSRSRLDQIRRGKS
ncbi:MAG: hypothetical protein ACOH10_15035 [Rhodoglobus sp.]